MAKGMGREMRRRSAAEHKARLAAAKKKRDVLDGIVKLLEGMPCPECRKKRRVTEALRMSEHQSAGRRCRGSHLAVGWFPDGLAVIPYDRYNDRECVEARALLRRTLRPAPASERKSTSVIGDRPASGPAVSGGLPGSKR